MAAKKVRHVNRQLTEEERARHAIVRETVMQDFPPRAVTHPPSPPGIPARIRDARETRRLTWHALAEIAGIADQATIRDIERGRDVKLSDLQRVATALGLKLELVEQVV